MSVWQTHRWNIYNTPWRQAFLSDIWPISFFWSHLMIFSASFFFFLPLSANWHHGVPLFINKLKCQPNKLPDNKPHVRLAKINITVFVISCLEITVRINNQILMNYWQIVKWLMVALFVVFAYYVINTTRPIGHKQSYSSSYLTDENKGWVK